MKSILRSTLSIVVFCLIAKVGFRSTFGQEFPTATPNPGIVGEPINFFTPVTDPTESNPPPFTYTWDFGDGQTAAGIEVSHTYLSPDTFTATITVTNGNGNTSNGSVNVVVDSPANTGNSTGPLQPPVFSSQPSTSANSAYVGDPVLFQSAANDPGGFPLTYTWNFGDGTIIIGGPTETHTYLAPGSYSVTESISNSTFISVSTPFIVTAIRHVDLGNFSRSKHHGRLSCSMPVPQGILRQSIVKSMVIVGSPGPNVKYFRLKLAGVMPPIGNYSFTVKFPASKESPATQISYSYSIFQ